MYTGFTDDMCCVAVGKCPNTVSGLMLWALHIVETWCDKFELSVNLIKTEHIVLTRRRKLSGFLEPQFVGVTLLCYMSVKYLWVALDS